MLAYFEGRVCVALLSIAPNIYAIRREFAANPTMREGESEAETFDFQTSTNNWFYRMHLGPV